MRVIHSDIPVTGAIGIWVLVNGGRVAVGCQLGHAVIVVPVGVGDQVRMPCAAGRRHRSGQPAEQRRRGEQHREQGHDRPGQTESLGRHGCRIAEASPREKRKLPQLRPPSAIQLAAAKSITTGSTSSLARARRSETAKALRKIPAVHLSKTPELPAAAWPRRVEKMINGARLTPDAARWLSATSAMGPRRRSWTLHPHPATPSFRRHGEAKTCACRR